jgi:hypothetical protein
MQTVVSMPVGELCETSGLFCKPLALRKGRICSLFQGFLKRVKKGVVSEF